jgi:hypothetical protein
VTTSSSLPVAITGVVLASLSLGWQAANYVLTGGRITVNLLVGAMGNGSMATAAPEKLSSEWLEGLAAQGFSRPVVAVTVANVGRQPVVVAGWGLKSGLGPSMHPMADSIGPSLPHRLDVGEAATWAVDMRAVQAFTQTTNETLGSSRPTPRRPPTPLERVEAQAGRPRGTDVVGIVELAAGRAKVSRGILRM